MDRRNFIKFTGLSIGGFLISSQYKGFAGENFRISNDIIGYPDEVTVVSDNKSFLLDSPDRKKWNSNNILVTLAEKKDAISVEIQSPDEKLKYIKLKWNIKQLASNKFLGDHWERSYGDLHWGDINESGIMPWYFMEYDGKVTNGFGVKTGCNAKCYWKVSSDYLELTLDVRSGGNGVNLGDRILPAAEIITMKGREEDSPYKSTNRFCKLMCEKPRLPKQPVYGINDWYFTYGMNSAELIIEHAALTADLATSNSNRPFCVIDAGWAEEAPGASRSGWGDNFHTPNSHFKDMAKLADRIRDTGMQPGLWTRPLCASRNDKQNLLLPVIPGRDNPKEPILDPTIPENIQRVRDYMKTYNEWKYDLVKHDYTTYDLFGKWGFQMFDSGNMTTDNWSFNNNSITNAEIILGLYRDIRNAAGDTLLIGCNTISHLSAGLFELQRIGDDTSGNEWARTRKMGVNTLGFRTPQHLSFYAADGDCVGLTTKIPWEKNKQWMQLVAESGTPLFISAQKEAVGAEQKEFIKYCFTIASTDIPTGEPLDWMENIVPKKWKLNGKIVEFNW